MVFFPKLRFNTNQFYMFYFQVPKILTHTSKSGLQQQAHLWVLKWGVSCVKKEPLDRVNWEVFQSKKKLLQMSFLWKNYTVLLFNYAIDNSYLTLSKWKINWVMILCVLKRKYRDMYLSCTQKAADLREKNFHLALHCMCVAFTLWESDEPY